MRTFKIALAIALLISAASGLRAEDADNHKVEFTSTTEVRTAFIVGTGTKLSDTTAMQDFFWKWRSGVTFDVTFFGSLDDPGFKSADGGNEIDFVLGLPLGKVGSLSLGTYLLAPIETIEAEYATVTWAKCVGPVTVSAQYLLGYGNSSYPDRFFLKVDYTPPRVKFSEKVDLVFPIRATWDTGIDSQEDAVLLRLRPELNIRASEGASVYIGWEGHQPLTDRENRSFQDGARIGLRLKF